MSEKRLKLITTGEPEDVDDVLFIIADGSSAWEGEVPVLAYYSYSEDYRVFYVLNKGGSERVDLVNCSGLKKVLDDYMFKGTKYIVSTYNPTLYYLFPGISNNDALFNTDNNFIPTLPISSLVRPEVDGFNSSSISQEDIRCMKACDSWYNNLTEYEKIVSALDTRINELFGSYKEFDITKEVKNQVGSYSADLSKESLVVSIISGTTYTDTINLEDWVLESKNGINPISGKLDITYMYSIEGEMYCGGQTIKAFRYEENVTSENMILELGPIQIEYMDYILKIYPLSKDVDEVIFTDCTLTIGVL